MVELYGGDGNIKGCRRSARFQKFYNRCNQLYFGGVLPEVVVMTAPLLKIPTTQKEAEQDQNWVDAGCYGIVGYDADGQHYIILDRGTCVFHTILAKTTCLHEMIHLYIGLEKGHGKDFKRQIRRIAGLGALDNLV